MPVFLRKYLATCDFPGCGVRTSCSIASRGGFVPQGGTLIFNVYVGSDHVFGFKILNFNIFGVFRKMNIFWGMEICVYFFRMITKLD